MAKLNARGRKQVKKSNFASPKGVGDNPSKDMYPIHDLKHARNALARVSQHGSEAEQRRVRRAVYKKYPSLDPKKKMNSDMRRAAGKSS